jgi:uncharacterized protein YqjF (DUF2071 family)
MTRPDPARRLALREPPQGVRPVLFQSWQHIAFLHWRWDPADIQAFLPPGLHVDTHDGEAWMGLVPFRMRRVRPRGLPALPWLSDFLELNLRTYVHADDGTPGVWFFSLDCNQPAAVHIARTLFHLPYRHARMRSDHPSPEALHYRSDLRSAAGRFHLAAHSGRTFHLADPGSLEFFLVERYVLFCHDPVRSTTWSGRVHHRPYPLTALTVDSLEETLFESNHFHAPLRPPDHTLATPGVDVAIYPLSPIPEPVAPNVGRLRHV